VAGSVGTELAASPVISDSRGEVSLPDTLEVGILGMMSSLTRRLASVRNHTASAARTARAFRLRSSRA
jgi:hypothetical protein